MATAMMMCCPLTTWAQTKRLVVTLTDGTEVYYQLHAEDNGGKYVPTVKLAGGSVTVEDDSYAWSGVKEFHIEESDPTSIAPNALMTDTDEPMTIYTIDGRRIAHGSKSGSQQALSLSSLPRGIYIIEKGQPGKQKVTFKLTKK